MQRYYYAWEGIPRKKKTTTAKTILLLLLNNMNNMNNNNVVHCCSHHKHHLYSSAAAGHHPNLTIKPIKTQHWNSLIRASFLGPHPLSSLSLYNDMMRCPTSPPPLPDHHTFSLLLKACELTKSLHKCREAHASILRRGLVYDAVVSTNLARSYAENGSIESARMVFEEMPERDLVSWNSMISCYCRAGLHGEVLILYDRMRAAGVRLDEFTAVGLLSSCAHVGALDLGVRVHRFAEEEGYLATNVFVGNALIEMYAKCGCIDRARSVFHGMGKRDIFTWNSMIVGLGIHGHGDEAISVFRRMLMSGVRPNSISFLGLLLGCSHQGLVDEGIRWFDAMSSEFGVRPGGKHYGCLVDMFGRAGKLDRAVETIKAWEAFGGADDPVLWRSLLSACKIHGSLEMGEVAMKKLISMGCHNGGDCSLLAGMYMRAGNRQGAAAMRKMVKYQMQHGATTTTRAGWSWIEACGDVRRFAADDVSHHDTEQI